MARGRRRGPLARCPHPPPASAPVMMIRIARGVWRAVRSAVRSTPTVTSTTHDGTVSRRISQANVASRPPVLEADYYYSSTEYCILRYHARYSSIFRRYIAIQCTRLSMRRTVGCGH